MATYNYLDIEGVKVLKAGIEAEIPTKVSELDNDSNFLTEAATVAQGEKADTAVQSVKIGDTEYKLGTNVILPAYPTTLPASDVADWAKAENKPSYTASEVGALPADTDLSVYALATEAGYDLGLSMDPSTYVMTLELKNKAGTALATKTLDFPIESMVVDAEYADGILTLKLQSGNTVDVDISVIVGGLVNDSFTIAGIDMKDDITVTELKTALGVPDTFAPVDAEKNVITEVKVNGTALAVTDRAVDIEVPEVEAIPVADIKKLFSNESNS